MIIVIIVIRRTEKRFFVRGFFHKFDKLARWRISMAPKAFEIYYSACSLEKRRISLRGKVKASGSSNFNFERSRGIKMEC